MFGWNPLHLLSVLYETVLGEVSSESIMKSLELMWKGMLGIFIVIVLIYLVIVILNKATGKKKDKKGE